MSFKIQSFTFNGFQENTYVVFDSESLETAIIDPGCYNAHEQAALEKFIAQNSLTVKYLLNTHCHIDHVLGNTFVKNQYNVPLMIHRLEQVILDNSYASATMYGFMNYERCEADIYLEEGQQILLGNNALDILFVPGHAPGHVAFYNTAERFCISGDVLFRESVGRTDFPYCNHNDLIDSIKTKMFALPDDTRVYAGHGPSTTIAHEKRYNPFV
ncbi:Glyoxylase, beta-lactamase superfamily II [Flexibacter flexilis DSM 6793]|uniref:Glyoxylase, beta-lactamase superfamily II n=1 Tax=Flexibacter flexilis DSM 6793 TaxID=927664 RepID=A0A1I1L9G7_9BACT|nr:MBL fold metallo-hydrolase [Flexibacter flexilis]SFC69605.1 Glyoxylase, beta-lactamase superfamily II [Flexibacter flexilis DSM 6793]